MKKKIILEKSLTLEIPVLGLKNPEIPGETFILVLLSPVSISDDKKISDIMTGQEDLHKFTTFKYILLLSTELKVLLNRMLHKTSKKEQ